MRVACTCFEVVRCSFSAATWSFSRLIKVFRSDLSTEQPHEIEETILYLNLNIYLVLKHLNATRTFHHPISFVPLP